MPDKTAASFDVALDVQFFSLPLTAEKDGDFLPKIPWFEGVVLDFEAAFLARFNHGGFPIRRGAAAGGSHVVNGKWLSANVFEAKFYRDRDALFDVAEVVFGGSEPFDVAAGGKKEKTGDD